ncbi:FecCD family ABC transporter permease [Parvibium lacunae]|uniref:Iron ABC transporter permease n=1 Tax=Parvibium lacunae TaxID=1888893 RepID=A0A368L6B0_9BURK|nr:iron chelate uptake ABC transporter family permease subunit [Parvibium lacunae]RCS59195.1 iron ABC transporter permease [Parvibium lacunae]
MRTIRLPLFGFMVIGILVALGLLSLCVGSDGWHSTWLWTALQSGWLPSSDLSARQEEAAWLWQIRLPRTVGALAVGALLGLGGALAQHLFRNPLAEPYLLGSAAGAQLAVVIVAAASASIGTSVSIVTSTASLLTHGIQFFSLVSFTSAAFMGAWASLMLTLVLARGAQSPIKLLLTGVVVGVVLNAVGELITLVEPNALRVKQSFMLGSVALIDQTACIKLLVAWLLLLPICLRCAKVLDVMSLGDHAATSLGIHLGRWRMVFVMLLALATALTVANAGLIAFVGLVAPHIAQQGVRYLSHTVHPGSAVWSSTRSHLMLSSLLGGGLLLLADIVARSLIAPQELPVGLLTAVLGGGYLLFLLKRGLYGRI